MTRRMYFSYFSTKSMCVQLFPYGISVLLRVMIFTFHQTKCQNVYYSNITLDFVNSWKVECL